MPAEVRVVTPHYAGLKPFRAPAYSLLEIAAEKLRALLQQQDKWPRPRRPLRPLVHPLRALGARRWPELRTLSAKCGVRGIRPDVSR